MNPDIALLDTDPDLRVRTHRRGRVNVRVNRIDLCWCGADERERDRMARRIAALEPDAFLVRLRRRRTVVLMGRQPMVMLGVIVIGVDVDVPRRPAGAGRREGETEHHRDEAMHRMSLWNRSHEVKRPFSYAHASGAAPASEGSGRATNRRRQGRAISRAHRLARLTRALSVAMPVLAYIWR